MPLLLLHGDNQIEMDDAVRAIRSRFDSADTVTYGGADVSLPDLAAAVQTAGLFASERLVIVDGLHDRLKGSKKDGPAEEIEALLASVPPTTTLLLAERGLPADHALLPLARNAGAEVRAFQTPRRQDLPRWVATRAVSHGVSIDRDAAELLADLTGANAVLIDTELEKLATYAGEEGTVTPWMVETLVGAVSQDSIFALVDAIASGDSRKAFELLRAQLESASSGSMEVALSLIRLLSRQMRILLGIRLGEESGRSRGQITSDLKLPRYYADRYFRQARRLSRQRLIASFEQLAALEQALKTGKADPATGLDLLLAELTS